jgi:hypothetical protein
MRSQSRAQRMKRRKNFEFMNSLPLLNNLFHQTLSKRKRRTRKSYLVKLSMLVMISPSKRTTKRIFPDSLLPREADVLQQRLRLQQSEEDPRVRGSLRTMMRTRTTSRQTSKLQILMTYLLRRMKTILQVS